MTLLLFGHLKVYGDASLFLRLESLSFISQDYENDLKQISFVGLDIKNTARTKRASVFNIDLEARYAVGQPVLSYVNVSEMYLLQKNEYINIHYGRQKYRWSALDELWSLGFFQPQFRWNSLESSPQGNVGFFFESTRKLHEKLSWMVYASPLFLPDQGPGYEMRDGKFQDSNPWFNPPARFIDFGGQVLPIDYSLTTPKNEEVVLRANFGAQVGYIFDEGYYVRASYLSTPSHQIAMTYKAVLVADRVQVEVAPQVYQEENVAVDFGYDSDSQRLGLFFLFNHPHAVNATAGFNYPDINSSLSWGPHLQTHIEGKYGSLKLHASGLWVSDGQIDEQGPDSGQITTSLTSKHLSKTAYKLGAHYKTFLTTSDVYSLKLEWVNGVDSTIRLIKIKNLLEIGQWWSINLDILLVDTSDEASVGHLRNLDQLIAGVRYEF